MATLGDRGRYPNEIQREREIFIDNLQVRVRWIIELIVVEQPCAMRVGIPDFQVALYLDTFRMKHSSSTAPALLRHCPSKIKPPQTLNPKPVLVNSRPRGSKPD